MTQEKNIPKLRFPEFRDQWSLNKFGSVTKRISNPVSVEAEMLYTQIGIRSHGKGIFHKEPVTGKELGNKRVFWVKENTLVVNIVFAWEQAVAKTSDKEIGLIASHRFPMYLPIENKFDLDYLLFFFLTKKGKSLLELASPGGAGRNKTLGQKEFENLSFLIPEYAEQKKIADFLSIIEEKLQSLKHKKSLLERYKKGVMQKIFSQEVRFRDEKGKAFQSWKMKTLGEVAERVKTKNNIGSNNVLTISAQYGLISQLDFFNKSVSGKDLSGYYLVTRNDFAYNKSYSNGFPMGAIKRLTNYDQGVVSTLYICFRFKEEVDNSFAEQYFEAGMQNIEIEKVAQEGARNHGLLNIGIDDFFNIELRFPSLPEQKRIAAFLSDIDKKIAQCRKQVEHTENYKNGLLQKMFC